MRKQIGRREPVPLPLRISPGGFSCCAGTARGARACPPAGQRVMPSRRYEKAVRRARALSAPRTRCASRPQALRGRDWRPGRRFVPASVPAAAARPCCSTSNAPTEGRLFGCSRFDNPRPPPTRWRATPKAALQPQHKRTRFVLLARVRVVCRRSVGVSPRLHCPDGPLPGKWVQTPAPDPESRECCSQG